MKINILNLFKRQKKLQEFYPRSDFIPEIKSKNSYPFFVSLENEEVYAYSTRFMIKSADLPLIEDLIFTIFNEKPNKEKECISHEGKTIHYYKFEDFNQIIIDIITNNGYLIKRLCNEQLEPPSPNIVFPNLDFEALGSLQGGLKFWLDVYWAPFWRCLSEEDKGKYLYSNNISNILREFLILHC